MILKAFKILPFMLASVNPSSFKLEQPKKATSEQQFNLNVPLTGGVNQTSNDGSYRYDYRKETGQAYNSALSVNFYNYIHNTRNGTNLTDPFIIPTETTLNLNTFTNSLFAIEITPYNYLKNVNGKTTLTLYLQNSNYVDTDTGLGLLALKYEIFTSTENYWQNYLDASNYATKTFNKDVYDSIQNPQNGFLYNKQTNIVDITEVNDPSINGTNNTFNIEIVTNKVNYVLIYLQPYIKNYTTTPYAFLYSKNSNVQTWIIRYGNVNVMEINGTQIVGNINYEVIDIPGIMWEVLSMPFTFISIAFNLTLFPGTPYQVNLSNLFLSILGALIFIFIMSKFVFKK